MGFKELFNENEFQQTFSFMKPEEPNYKKIGRYKNRDSYINAMSKGGKSTEVSAEKLINARIGSPMLPKEEVLGVYPAAYTIPAFTLPSGRVRPEWYVAFVHTKTVENVNPNNPYYDRPRHRLLAMWQGRDRKFPREKALDPYAQIVGGLSWIGNDLDVAWVDPEYRGNKEHANIPNLYAALRKFVAQFGVIGLKPGDDLTSKSFRASQAKHDYDQYLTWKQNNPR